MEFKTTIVGFLLLFFLILLVGPGFSRGTLRVKNRVPEVYEIDYKGPETHTYIPPPNRAADRSRVHHKTSMARRKSKVHKARRTKCLLGTLVPCVLHGSNVERLGYVPGSFVTHCSPYAGLYLTGNSFFGWNCIAPWFSYPTRTAIRRKFNIEGGCEALARSYGCCCVSFMGEEVPREQCETACDLATHIFCHACALCQEAREVRRRLPPPGLTSQPPVFVMIPQATGREGA